MCKRSSLSGQVQDREPFELRHVAEVVYPGPMVHAECKVSMAMGVSDFRVSVLYMSHRWKWISLVWSKNWRSQSSSDCESTSHKSGFIEKWSVETSIPDLTWSHVLITESRYAIFQDETKALGEGEYKRELEGVGFQIEPPATRVTCGSCLDGAKI